MQRLFLIATLAACASVASAETLPRFPPSSTWNRNIAGAALHPQSADMIATLSGLGGFGFGRLQIDFAMNVVRAAAGSPTRSIVDYPYDDYYSPDCEPLGSSMPVPANAAIEGNSGLTCDNENDDCHLLVVQGDTVFEAYHVTASGSGSLEAQCLVKWHLRTNYPGTGRGDHCTSADAAGFPIAPLLFNADEVHAAMQLPDGDIGHALRFILPNARMASDISLGGDEGKLYVRPATHAGGPSGPAGSVPYGSRLRLRADFPMTGYSAAAQVILRTMQRYGIVLADGGNIALTAESDRYTTHSWAELGIGSRVFDQTPNAQDVLASDFQIIDTGPRIAETYQCARTAVSADTIFLDGHE
ncbi:hypothetical protein DFR29_10323 [Tahibacter aquaticus]|uniref:Phosphodiester glycosidase domain-containing protein n=1 Tax=Tahibacter aquaticus TaxID=520092 RepID=A0A4R6Z4B0_9GAMM|nr:hypothetical protein [Tahibacter aquaticus]TDR46492.1 hypothetical protein DFR29_10323 [Tahibacter aquaticus]